MRARTIQVTLLTAKTYADMRLYKMKIAILPYKIMQSLTTLQCRC